MLDMRAALVERLIDKMNECGISYAVLRNYEKFPAFSHDLDLVVASNHIDCFREIVKGLAKQLGWDFVRECDHWAQSPQRAHNIEVFRFYHSDPIYYMQVDIFHGFPIWGKALFKEQDLLDDALLDPTGRFMRVSPVKENTMRLLQISKLLKFPDAKEKVRLYTSRVRDFCHEQENRDLLFHQIKIYFGIRGQKALYALLEGNYAAFSRHMRMAKLHFWLASLINNPLAVFNDVVARLGDYWRLFGSRPCGFEVCIQNGDMESLNIVTKALDNLSARGVLPVWTGVNMYRPWLNWEERRVLERGGIVLKKRCWRSGRRCKCITISSDEASLQRRFFLMLVDRDMKEL